MNNPLITIAIPAYKAPFLKDAIKSAINQTYKNIEVVVCDDCSPYNLDKIVSEFIDPRISYYKNEKNLGSEDPAGNWNRCLAHAKGKYFCLLCDDDMYAPTFVEEMYSLTLKYPTVKVFRSGVNEIDMEGNVFSYFPSSPEYESVNDYMWHVYNVFRRQTISEWMLDTENMRTFGGYYRMPLAWGSDYHSIYQFALEDGIVSTTKRLVNFRNDGQNISSDYSKNAPQKIKAYKIKHDAARDFIRKNNLPNMQMLLPLIDRREKGEIDWQMSVVGAKDLLYFTRRRNEFNLTTRTLIKLWKNQILTLIGFYNKNK